MNSTHGFCASDLSFGPSVDGCDRTFDFSLTFEESILSIVPSAFLLILGPLQLLFLQKKAIRVGGRKLQLLKIV